MMNAPNREISWLETFPPDIWAYFVYYLEADHLERLNMTGATLLRQRLKFPTVVTSIKLRGDVFVFNPLPRFLNDFPSLKELSIHNIKHEWCKRIGLTVDSIPSGVRTLELSGNVGEERIHLFGSCTTWNLSKHLPHLGTLHLRNIVFEESWMAHTPPSLTNLNIGLWSCTVELPPTLIHFEAKRVGLPGRFHQENTFVSKLPPSLESFVVTVSMSEIHLLVPLLPPSIRRLDLGRSAPKYGCKPPQSLLSKLPIFLTCLTVPKSFEIDFKTSPEMFSSLPSTLTELRLVPDFPYSAWHLTPRQVSILEIFIPDSSLSRISKSLDTEAPSIPFDALPRSITRLEVLGKFMDMHFCGPPDESTRSYFPPHLRFLWIPFVQLSPAAAKFLPSSLTYLCIGNLCERVCEHLPAGLKTLLSYQTLMSPNLIKFLPKALTFLNLSIVRSDECWFHYDTGTRIDSISKLPEYTIHEKCISNTFDWTNSSPFPPTLTYLRLSGKHNIKSSLIRRQRLPNLLELKLY